MRLLGIAALLGLVACGSGGSQAPGSATFAGTIGGKSLTPRDAISGVVSFSANGVPGHAAVIAIASSAGICSLGGAGKEPASTQYLVLSVFRLQPDYSAAPPSGPGTYPVGALTIENAVAVFAGTDASCQLTTQELSVASSGSVTLTAVGDRYAGAYDLTFAFGDHVTGTFDAPACGGLAQLGPGTGSLACQP